MLRPEIITRNPYPIRWLVLGCALLGASIATYRSPTVEPSFPAPALTIEEVLRPAPRPVEAAPASTIQLVFRAGDATYMQLANAGTVPHGPPALFDRGEVDGWQTAAIGAVTPEDVPGAYRGWFGRSVIVDGTCEATVTGFAVVGRLTGSPDYAGETEWTAANVLALGAPVLAARLDGCRGTLARDARLAPVVIPTPIDDAALANRARAKLLASGAAYDAQHAWEAVERTGAWHASETAAIETIVVRHPTTGVTWVSAHGRIDEGCGGLEINLWALYRVDGDELVVVEQRDLGDLWSIAKLIDIEGDGTLELVGAPWLATDVVVTRADGEELARVALPFFGCPC